MDVLEPLTPEDFAMRYTERVFPFVETDEAVILAYGHPDKEEFVDLVYQYDRLSDVEYAEKHSVSDVQRVWAVRHSDTADNYADGWVLSWAGITEQTPNSFPVTIIRR